MENEIWAEIKEYPFYMVSNYGRVKTIERIRPNGRGYYRRKKSIILKQGIARGYKKVCLYNEKGSKTITIHRLVADAFLENPEKKPQVNHINGIKTDNRASNLEWCTAKENTQHAIKNGLVIKSKRSKLNDSDFEEIKRLLMLGLTQKKIGKKFNLTQTAISNIKTRKKWQI